MRFEECRANLDAERFGFLRLDPERFLYVGHDTVCRLIVKRLDVLTNMTSSAVRFQRPLIKQ